MKTVFRDRKDPLASILGGGGSVHVVGLGRSGMAAANLLASMGCSVVVTDKATPGQGAGDQGGLHPDVRVHWGGHPEELFLNCDLIVLSPGVPGDLEPILAASSRGVPVIGEMELAFRLTVTPWVAVTGSNGKSTTVTLIDCMAKEGGVSVLTGGNLGTPVTRFVSGKPGAHFILAEVSSFQLETTETFHPSMAALLNITPDHLDRYPSEEEYIRAKARIFNQMEDGDWAVTNADDGVVGRVTRTLRPKRFPFSRLKVLGEGVCVHQGRIVIFEEGRQHPVMEAGHLAIPGSHNLENALAAVAVAWRMGVPPEAMARAMRSFRGLEHRMELVGYFRGVPIFNDSKGTNVGATLRSLEGMGNDVILILGGKDKGTSYQPLVRPVSRKVTHLILLGEAADRMEEAFRGATGIVRVSGLDEAVREAVQRARPGSEILFSPACSSYDMFSSFEERGRVFKDAARKYMRLME
ncbi:MAG: UDP-N-acetylmuramoyl-L-alanine--D-glutamate ligase [bacterium]|nr:MAG: UDP-N-acetylmuramoyl-L-alanine--D-glutamate ligase [bacterium]